MENVKNFKVEFHNGKLDYKPGESIVGCVSFDLTRDTAIDCVRLKFNGLAKVHWTAEVTELNKDKPPTDGTKSDQPATTKKIVSYDAKEEWFHHQQNLMNNAKSDMLKKGNHSYDFEFSIPKNIPGSMEHSVGSISYTAEACIEPLELNAKKQFVINEHLDLNNNRSLLDSVRKSAKKEFLWEQVFLAFQPHKEAVIATFSCRRGGFVPGQAMLYDIKIENQNTTRDITYITVALNKIMKFITPTGTKTEKVTLCEQRVYEIVPKLSTRKYENQVLDVPSATKATSVLSKVIKTKYQLVLKFGAGGLTLKMDCILPMVIGTEPFECDAPGYVESPPSYDEALKAGSAAFPSAPSAEDKASWTDKLKFWK